MALYIIHSIQSIPKVITVEKEPSTGKSLYTIKVIAAMEVRFKPASGRTDYFITTCIFRSENWVFLYSVALRAPAFVWIMNRDARLHNGTNKMDLMLSLWIFFILHRLSTMAKCSCAYLLYNPQPCSHTLTLIQTRSLHVRWRSTTSFLNMFISLLWEYLLSICLHAVHFFGGL